LPTLEIWKYETTPWGFDAGQSGEAWPAVKILKNGGIKHKTGEQTGEQIEV
jgi:hypothetical protein